LLRETRRKRLPDQWISLSGADPLNLVGVLTPGPRLPALTDNRLIYRDGLPVATLSAGKVDFLTTLDGTSRWEAEKRLIRSAACFLTSAKERLERIHDLAALPSADSLIGMRIFPSALVSARDRRKQT
jgi:hypothetical protein